MPEDKNLPSAFSLFRPSFDALMVNVWSFFALLFLPLTYLIIDSLFFRENRAAQPSSPLEGPELALLLVGVVSMFLVAPALTYLQLQSAKGKEVSIGKALRVGFSRFWEFYGLILLLAVLFVGGLVLFIIPGLLMLKRYILAPYYFYDHDLSIGNAMKRSHEDSKEFGGALWGLIGVSILVSLPGTIRPLVLIGAVLQVTYYCAPAVRYLQIKSAAKHKA